MVILSFCAPLNCIYKNMKTLRKGDHDHTVSLLQRMLSQSGHPVEISQEFDDNTDNKVREFQRASHLASDGVVGKKTWEKLFIGAYNFGLGATNYMLEKNEWFEQYVEKDTIYLHHTAGLHRPDYTIGWWERDNEPGQLMRVGTSFVIGRKSIDGDTSFDGMTYRAFKEIYWAHHLGTKLGQNKLFNQKSIGIEICALGYLSKKTDGTFLFETNNTKIEVPRSEVCELDREWRGHRYFQKYTAKQIDECERLILTLAKIFDIPLKDVRYDRSWFDLNDSAMAGVPGLWMHCNVRKDKTDCFPQPEFIEMLNGLHSKYQNFQPDYSTMESAVAGNPKDLDDELIKNYTRDLD